MATFQELRRAAEITLKDKTSGKRILEIQAILRKHHAFSGLTPSKATSILEDLGPTFVKMGQIASNRSDVIPKEYADAFKVLRASVTPVLFPLVIEAIEQSLGQPWQEVFVCIEEQPLGSASVAQVHRARLILDDFADQGPLVAVKVQRPHIAEKMAEDLMLARHALALVDLVRADDDIMLTVAELVDELERTTAEELNFSVELANLERFSSVIAGQRGVFCPRVYPKVSSDTVLVMEYVEGVSINNVEALRAQANDPRALGKRLAESYVDQALDKGFFHADPHPGNILVRDGSIVWIDLGMTGTLSVVERTLVGRLFAAVAKNDPFALKDALLTLAKPNALVNHGQLLNQLDALLATYASANLSEINVGSAMLDVIEIMRTQHLALPSSLTMLARGTVTLEGVLVDIAPDISVIDIISSHVNRQAFGFDAMGSKVKEMVSASAASAEAFVRLPAQASRTLDMLDRGQLKVGADIEVPDDLIDALYSVSGTVSLALISAGLFVGSSLITQTNMEPTFLGVPLFGITGYVGAFILGSYVIWRTLATRHKQRSAKKIK